MGLQAKTVANAMIRHWLTIFDVPAVICSDRGSQFVGTWFKTMCKHMGIRHAKTVAYHSRSNGRAEVAGRQMFEKFRQLHIDEPGRNWYNSLWRVPQAYHDLPGPTGLSPHRYVYLLPQLCFICVHMPISGLSSLVQFLYMPATVGRPVC